MRTYRVKGLPRVDGEDYENSLTVAIVILRDGFVLVLACGVPDLEFDLDAIEGDDLEHVIDSDGHHIVLHELALAVPQQQVALADPRVADYDDLLQIIELLLFLAFYLPERFHTQLII